MSQPTYTKTDIQTIIKDHIAQEFIHDLSRADLTLDTPLIEEGIIDSMGIFRLITFLQEQFGFTIEPQDVVLESFETITAITKLVETRKA